MYYVVQTDTLIEDGVLNLRQAEEIHRRAKAAMVTLVINSLLIGGIVAAAIGLVLWLNDAASVAVVGGLSAVAGIAILRFSDDLYRMFGNAAALIGAGMLVTGAGMELAKTYPQVATGMMLSLGAVIAVAGLVGIWRGGAKLRFASGAILLMGLGLHFAGLMYGVEQSDLTIFPTPVLHLYSAILIIAAGSVLDLRVVTAFAIMPLAQMFETGTFYDHAMYAFYSPEPLLTILQMGGLIGLCVWVARRSGDVVQRQVGVLAVMAFIVANLCFLVGSLWGDVIGDSIWGPVRADFTGAGRREAFYAARDAFEANAFTISESVFSVVWALLLAAGVIASALGNWRGLFNTAMTFGGIHAYTQMFETFGAEPLAFVIGGLAAVPVAWGLWRLDAKLWGGGGPAPQDA